jgi:hypothetical protein
MLGVCQPGQTERTAARPPHPFPYPPPPPHECSRPAGIVHLCGCHSHRPCAWVVAGSGGAAALAGRARAAPHRYYPVAVPPPPTQTAADDRGRAPCSAAGGCDPSPPRPRPRPRPGPQPGASPASRGSPGCRRCGSATRAAAAAAAAGGCGSASCASRPRGVPPSPLVAAWHATGGAPRSLRKHLMIDHHALRGGGGWGGISAPRPQTQGQQQQQVQRRSGKVSQHLRRLAARSASSVTASEAASPINTRGALPNVPPLGSSAAASPSLRRSALDCAAASWAAATRPSLSSSVS